MTAPAGSQLPLAAPRRASALVPVVVGACLGFAASIFGLALPWLAAAVVAALGLARGRHRVLLLRAAGLLAGSLVYIAVGLAMNLFDASEVGSGSGG